MKITLPRGGATMASGRPASLLNCPKHSNCHTPFPPSRLARSLGATGAMGAYIMGTDVVKGGKVKSKGGEADDLLDPGIHPAKELLVKCYKPWLGHLS